MKGGISFSVEALFAGAYNEKKQLLVYDIYYQQQQPAHTWEGVRYGGKDLN